MKERLKAESESPEELAKAPKAILMDLSAYSDPENAKAKWNYDWDLLCAFVSFDSLPRNKWAFQK